MRKRPSENFQVTSTRFLSTVAHKVFKYKSLAFLALFIIIWSYRANILSLICRSTTIKEGEESDLGAKVSVIDKKVDRFEKFLESVKVIYVDRTEGLQHSWNSLRDSVPSPDKVLTQLSEKRKLVQPKDFNKSFEQLHDMSVDKKTTSENETQRNMNEEKKKKKLGVDTKINEPFLSTKVTKPTVINSHQKEHKKNEDNKFKMFPPTTDDLGMFAAYVPKHSIIELLDQPIINPHNYSFIHNQEKVCHDEDIDILFVAPSAPNNTKRRSNFRKTELYQRKHFPELKAKFLFFTGKPEADGGENLVEQKINIEADKYSDIIQQDFIDVYKNIRLKAVTMLKWAITYCSNAKYVIRTDDDVSVNLKNLVTAIQETGSQMDNFILGHVRTNDIPARNRHSKYYLSPTEYPNQKFPAFAIGGLLGYPMKTVQLLYESSLRVPAVWLDDVYITGICRMTINATLVSHPLFDFKHLKT